jgi:hypothetical protein
MQRYFGSGLEPGGPAIAYIIDDAPFSAVSNCWRNTEKPLRATAWRTDAVLEANLMRQCASLGLFHHRDDLGLKIAAFEIDGTPDGSPYTLIG